MFSRIFIERPRLAAVISLVMVLAGMLSIGKLPVAEYPEVAPPSIMVMATYPGASAIEVNESVAMPLEAELNGIEDMIYFYSNCDNNGGYTCTLTFKSGVDDDIAMVNTQNAIKRAESKLPTEVRSTGVSVFKRSSDVLCVFTYMTDGTHMSVPELNNYVGTKIVDALSRVDGISQADVMGAQIYSMRIWMDPARMAALNVSTDDIATAISNQNVQAAAGSIGNEESGQYLQYKLNLRGRLKTVEEFENVIVRSDNDGNLLRLKDIARVELGAKGYNAQAVFNGQDAVSVAIYRNTDANALATVNRAKKVIAQFEERLPEGVHSEIAFDPTRFIVISMQEIVETLIIALLLVILITYLFLQDWRATLVPSVAIPVSLMGTFPFMVIMGLSINVLTMFGLVLVIGSLVDDAIVVVENCQSLMAREKLNAKDAAIKSMEQITGAIIATTLVTVACYMPLAFYGGMVGSIYKQFSYTMCISLCLSTVVAMTLSPALCSLIMRPPREKAPWIFKPFNVVLDGGRSIYLFCVKKLVHQGIITLLLLAGIAAGIYLISGHVHSSFLPEEDKGTIFVHIELPPGATIARTMDAIQRVQARLREDPAVKNVMAVGGFSFITGESENGGLLFVDLQDWAQRTTPETQMGALKQRFQGILNEFPEISSMVFTPPAIMGLGITGGVTCVLCNEGNATEAEVAEEAHRIANELNAKPEVQYAMCTFTADTPQLRGDLDRDKAEALGLTAGMVFSALQSQFGSYYINDFNYGGEVFYVKMQSDKNYRVTLDDIRDLQIRNTYGEMVPLSSVCSLSFIIGPRRLERFNKELSSEIDIQGASGVSSSRIMSMVENLELKPGYHLEWRDMSYQERENQGQIVTLVALAMLFAYLFLVGQYESWTIPIPVMLTVLTALLGAFAGMYLLKEDLSIYAQLGLVMLIGLTAKNAILMVEFSKQEREAGKDVYTAAINGANLRFRAVLMTAWSFLFGVFPLVIATGAGAGSRRAIGISTFSGMLLATIFGIIMTPALYAVFQRMRETIKRFFHLAV
jgi:hydrophobe/amphiphile efflux-1 (HAE1) family protein